MTPIRNVSGLRKRTPTGALIALALLSLCATLRLPAAESGANELRGISDALAGDLEVAAFEHKLTNGVQNWSDQSSAKLESMGGHNVAWGLGFLVCIGAVVMVRYVPRFISANDRRLDARLAAAAAAAAHAPAHMVDEERSFSEFATRFRIGPPGEISAKTASEPELPAPTTPSKVPASSSSDVSPGKVKPAEKSEVHTSAAPAKVDRVAEFFSEAPELLRQLRTIGAKLEGSEGGALVELAAVVNNIKTASEVPELAPIWQLTTSLSALLDQLITKKRQVTGSTLRTITAALQLADKLAQTGVRADLAADPPIRVLAVDDDPISRHAVSFALKKALNLPDLASEGETALELATETTYDAIFLDIQMPGMDGFELCKLIHETEANRQTPVVFITCQSDFASREKSLAVGACDLISKPFLTFEVTLKALTLVLAARLEHTDPAPEETASKSEPKEAVAAAS